MKKTVFSLLLLFLLFATALILRPRISIAQSGGDPPALISQVTITRSLDQSIHVVQSNEERIDLNASEAASVDIQLSAGNGVVLVRAPEGGRVNGQRELEINTDQQGRDITLTFNPQDDTGLSYIEVSDGQRIEVAVQFWVGPHAALGGPGPNLTF